MHRGIGDRHGEAWALNALGEVARTAGAAADSVARHSLAHRIAVEIGVIDEQARAQAGLGHAHHALGAGSRARGHFERAVLLYTDLGMPEADELRGELATVPDGR
jgi:hypothetical protein